MPFRVAFLLLSIIFSCNAQSQSTLFSSMKNVLKEEECDFASLDEKLGSVPHQYRYGTGIPDERLYATFVGVTDSMKAARLQIDILTKKYGGIELSAYPVRHGGGIGWTILASQFATKNEACAVLQKVRQNDELPVAWIFKWTPAQKLEMSIDDRHIMKAAPEISFIREKPNKFVSLQDRFVVLPFQIDATVSTDSVIKAFRSRYSKIEASVMLIGDNRRYLVLGSYLNSSEIKSLDRTLRQHGVYSHILNSGGLSRSLEELTNEMFVLVSSCAYFCKVDDITNTAEAQTHAAIKVGSKGGSDSTLIPQIDFRTTDFKGDVLRDKLLKCIESGGFLSTEKVFECTGFFFTPEMAMSCLKKAVCEGLPLPRNSDLTASQIVLQCLNGDKKSCSTLTLPNEVISKLLEQKLNCLTELGNQNCSGEFIKKLNDLENRIEITSWCLFDSSTYCSEKYWKELGENELVVEFKILAKRCYIDNKFDKNVCVDFLRESRLIYHYETALAQCLLQEDCDSLIPDYNRIKVQIEKIEALHKVALKKSIGEYTEKVKVISVEAEKFAAKVEECLKLKDTNGQVSETCVANAVFSQEELQRLECTRASESIEEFAACTGQENIDKYLAQIECTKNSSDIYQKSKCLEIELPPEVKQCIDPVAGATLSECLVSKVPSVKVGQCDGVMLVEAEDFNDTIKKCFPNDLDTANEYLECLDKATSNTGYISCSQHGLNEDERKVLSSVSCLANAQNNYERLACSSEAMNDKNVSDALECASQNSEASDIAFCMAAKNLPPEARKVAKCSSTGNAASFALCMSNSSLTSEQQIIVSCLAKTGGEPYSSAACMAGELIVYELTKCLTGTFGKDCFGPNNELVKLGTAIGDAIGHIGKEAEKFVQNVGRELDNLGRNVADEFRRAQENFSRSDLGKLGRALDPSSWF